MYHLRSLFSVKLNKLSSLMLGTAMLFCSANAAHAAMSQATPSRQTLNQTHLSAMKGSDISSIDWRSPEMKLKFDLAESDWTDGIDLILSMNPQGNIAKRGPVLVSLNNSAPLKLNPYGKGFDARLRFDENFARAKGNVITIRAPAPDGKRCLTPEHGKWDVDTKKSSIVVRSRAKSRSLYLREVTERLSNPATAPKTVSILASGTEKAKLQMLAAQGIALQTQDIPNFKTTAGRSDLELIIGRRDELAPRVSDRSILSDSGSKVTVHKGRPMRLVITGDTDFEVMEAAKAFASYALPPVRRRKSSTGELMFQASFADRHTELEGQTRFSDLDQGFYALDWSGAPNTIKFSVADPITTTGRVMLRLNTGPNIDSDSQLLVELNGKSLGFAQLDRKRKTVNFDIPEGALLGADNVLKITPKLNKRASVDTFGDSCPSLEDVPGFYISKNSRIELNREYKSPLSELSRLTANGGLFAAQNAKDTHIVLSATSSKDLGASLEVMAKLAKTSGSGWTDATVSRNAAAVSGKNILIVGPKAARTGLLEDAPRALSTALKGQSSTGQLARNTGEYDKFASADAASTLRIYAAKAQSKNRINGGGVAAVFPQGKNLIGVISSTPGRSFSSVSDDLLKPKQWNALSGSVSRWNSRNVLMTQTAIATPSLSMPSLSPAKLTGFNIARLENSLSEMMTRMVGFTEMASIKFEDMRDAVETRLAQSGFEPAENAGGKSAPLKMPAYKQRANASTTTVAAPKGKSETLPMPAFKTSAKTKTKTMPHKTASVQKPTLVKTSEVKAPLSPSLRGLSKVESSAPKFKNPLKGPTLTDKFENISTAFRSKINSLNTERLHHGVNAAKSSIKSPVKTVTALLEKPATYYNILIAIALTIMALLLSLVSPKQKRHARQLALLHKD